MPPSKPAGSALMEATQAMGTANSMPMDDAEAMTMFLRIRQLEKEVEILMRQVKHLDGPERFERVVVRAQIDCVILLVGEPDKEHLAGEIVMSSRECRMLEKQLAKARSQIMK